MTGGQADRRAGGSRMSWLSPSGGYLSFYGGHSPRAADRGSLPPSRQTKRAASLNTIIATASGRRRPGPDRGGWES